MSTTTTTTTTTKTPASIQAIIKALTGESELSNETRRAFFAELESFAQQHTAEKLTGDLTLGSSGWSVNVHGKEFLSGASVELTTENHTVIIMSTDAITPDGDIYNNHHGTIEELSE